MLGKTFKSIRYIIQAAYDYEDLTSLVVMQVLRVTLIIQTKTMLIIKNRSYSCLIYRKTMCTLLRQTQNICRNICFANMPNHVFYLVET